MFILGSHESLKYISTEQNWRHWSKNQCFDKIWCIMFLSWKAGETSNPFHFLMPTPNPLSSQKSPTCRNCAQSALIECPTNNNTTPLNLVHFVTATAHSIYNCWVKLFRMFFEWRPVLNNVVFKKIFGHDGERKTSVVMCLFGRGITGPRTVNNSNKKCEGKGTYGFIWEIVWGKMVIFFRSMSG